MAVIRRLVLGSVAAGFAMWLVGFVFWGPLLGWIPYSVTPDANAEAIQAVLRAQLGPTGTGVYVVPSPATTAGTILHAGGPVATIFFTNAGLPAVDTAALLIGLGLSIGCALLLAIALWRVPLDWGGRARLVAIVALAIVGYGAIGQPIYNHAPWRYFLFALAADWTSWTVAGLVLSRWFLPAPAVPGVQSSAR